jgi:hypothetical protein
MKIKDWAISVGDKITDFLIWDIWTVPELEQQDIKIYEYNQWNTSDCTLYSAFWAISDLMNYEFTKNEIAEIVAKSYEMGRVQGRWRYTQLGVDCVRKYWNDKNPDNKVISVKTNLWAEDFLDAFNKWYTIVVTYNGNSEYNMDYWKDWVVDWTKFQPSTYWHATSLIHIDDYNIKDSYH